MTITSITFDQLVLAAMFCIATREAMVLLLPDHIAGPGGWLIDIPVEK